MKVICIGMLFLLPALRSISQARYLQLINDADALYEASDFLQAAALYEKAFKIRKPHLTDIFYCACSYAEGGDSNKAMKMLQKAADNGFFEYDRLLTGERFKQIPKDHNWTLLLNKAMANYNEKKRAYGTDLVKELVTIFDSDQYYRLQLDSLYKMKDPSPQLMSQLSDSILYYDTINIDRVVKIIDRFGWPGIDDVGDKGNMTVFLVIQHANSAIQKKYLPQLKRSIKKHQSRPDYYAYLIDRILTDENKKQRYGTQLKLNEDTGKYELLPVKRPRLLNKRRKSLGLSTIEEYLKISN